MLRGPDRFVGSSLPPRSLLSEKQNVTFNKTRRGCLHANLESTLGLTQCDTPFEQPCDDPEV